MCLCLYWENEPSAPPELQPHASPPQTPHFLFAFCIGCTDSQAAASTDTARYTDSSHLAESFYPEATSIGVKTTRLYITAETSEATHAALCSWDDRGMRAAVSTGTRAELEHWLEEQWGTLERWKLEEEMLLEGLDLQELLQLQEALEDESWSDVLMFWSGIIATHDSMEIWSCKFWDHLVWSLHVNMHV